MGGTGEDMGWGGEGRERERRKGREREERGYSPTKLKFLAPPVVVYVDFEKLFIPFRISLQIASQTNDSLIGMEMSVFLFNRCQSGRDTYRL